MTYSVVKLDGRFSYRDWFGYYLGFSGSMSDRQGPVRFNDAIKWFTNTYGWSAEIRQYDRIMKWTSPQQYLAKLNPVNPVRLATNGLNQRSEHCNPHWSWTNHYQDLRIYVASEKELSFFQLAMPSVIPR